jgi:hypothetical protein
VTLRAVIEIPITTTKLAYIPRPRATAAGNDPSHLTARLVGLEGEVPKTIDVHLDFAIFVGEPLTMLRSTPRHDPQHCR